jgi:hypothetical protein
MRHWSISHILDILLLAADNIYHTIRIQQVTNWDKLDLGRGTLAATDIVDGRFWSVLEWISKLIAGLCTGRSAPARVNIR